MGAKLAGLENKENNLDLSSSCLHDSELMLGLERGYLTVSKNEKIHDLSYNVA